jgi:hypothetical protein
MCTIFAMSAYMHLFLTDSVGEIYDNLHFPKWIIIPSGIVKTLGIVVMIINKPIKLKEWVYAGFFFDASIAFISHILSSDGGYLFSVLALIALIISRIYWPKVYNI